MVKSWLIALGLALLAPWPASAAPTLQQLVELTDLSSQAVSPNGQWVAFRQDRASLAANRVEFSWWVVASDGSAEPQAIAYGGAALWNAAGWAVVEPPIWSADSRWIYYRALIDGEVQVWRAAADGSGAKQITRDAADVESFTLEGETRLTYQVRAPRDAILAAERETYDAGVLVDQTIDPAQNLFGALEINGRLSSQRLFGRWFGRGRLLDDRPPRTRVVDLSSLAVTDGSQEASTPPVASIGPNDPYVVTFASKEGFGRGELSTTATTTRVRVVRGDGSVTACDTGPCVEARIATAAWRPGRNQILLTTSDRARAQTLYLWDVDSGQSRQIASVDGSTQGGAVQSSGCGLSARFAACVVSGPLSPPRLERIDFEDGTRKVLAAPNLGLAAESGLKVERLDWTDETGQHFAARLLTPKDARGRLPLFVTYYNCRGYLRGATGDQWPLSAFAQAGIATLCINMALPRNDVQDSVADYETALRGVRSAIDLLDRRGLIDRRKVGMGGLSFGSEVALWVAMKSDLLAAVSTTSVQIEPAYYWFNGVKGRDIHDTLRQAWGLGAPEETPERWKQITAAANVDAIKTPVLMQMPEQEFRPTIELIARLSNSTTPSEVRVFANEPHILTQPRHRLAAYARNLDWFRFWLQDYEDPAPDKTEQYRRWRVQKAEQLVGRKPDPP